MLPGSAQPTRSLARLAATVLIGTGVLNGCTESAAAQAKAIADACASSTNMPQAVCACLGERAKADLTADERAFVLATLREEDENIEELRGKLGFEGAMKAGMFMTNAATCAREAASGTTE